jgi:hypothetical protein
MARLSTATLVSALVRAADRAGGSAMVLARGDASAGGLLLLLLERGHPPRFVERGSDSAGRARLVPAGPKMLGSESETSDYWRKRRGNDPDLWVVELSIASAERFAAETMAFD